MPTRYASEKRALGVCDICGFTYKLKTLKMVVVNRRETNLRACPECWDPDHPQLQVGQYPVYDPQALRNPKPDTAQHAEARAQIVPLTAVTARGVVGTMEGVVQ